MYDNRAHNNAYNNMRMLTQSARAPRHVYFLKFDSYLVIDTKCTFSTTGEQDYHATEADSGH